MIMKYKNHLLFHGGRGENKRKKGRKKGRENEERKEGKGTLSSSQKFLGPYLSQTAHMHSQIKSGILVLSHSHISS